MFDIGFWELTVIGVVALLVVGPERLPGLARTVGLYVGKLKRWVSQVRGEVERELRAEELRQAMRKAENSETLSSISKVVKGNGVADAMRSAGASLRSAVDSVAAESDRTAQAPPSEVPATPLSGPVNSPTDASSASTEVPAPRKGVERERGSG